ncbi:MAG: hemolysin family protein [Phycisphaerae bacterium]
MDFALGALFLGLTLYASALSFALLAYSRAKLTTQLSADSQRRWLDWMDRYESELQALVSFLRLTCSISLVFWVFASYSSAAGDHVAWRTYIWPIGLTVLLLVIFGIGVPHALSAHAGEALLARSLPVLHVLRIVLAPIGWLYSAIEFIVRRLLGRPEITAESEYVSAEQEILNAVSEGEAQGAVDSGQKEIIRSVFQLSERTVSAIMTPRTDIISLAANSNYEQARQAVVDCGHSRIPVHEDSVDHIVGVLYAKDLLRLRPEDPFDVRKNMRAAPYVPETKSISDLLDEFRQTKVHIAIVLDEYGGTAGLVTIEDILEELVGDIADEFDTPETPRVLRVDADTLDVDGRVSVREINESLGTQLPEDGDYETIGGFVFSSLGRVPARGDAFTHDNVQVIVADAEPRKINRVRLRLLREAEATSSP